MEKYKINVPRDIRYLSQWTDFGSQLPNSHVILNKKLTGVGATEFFLSNTEKVILCTPRKALIESKKTKHPEACIYRFLEDNVQSDGGKSKKSPKKSTFKEILKYNKEVVRYVQDCFREQKTPKIMVTYDSLHHVINALNSIRKDEVKSWTLVIDEFQVIFSDSCFKSLTEMMFLENAKCFEKVIFLSATPFLDKYLDMMDEFKNIPYIELEWDASMEEKALVHNITIKKDNSRIKICKKIVDKMRAGETVKFGNKEIDTKEAVFYINNVSDIIRIVKGCGLQQDEINILCSESNKDKLNKNGLVLGTFPKKGDPHKMFTFATKSVFLGVDFYSECAYSYVFADPSQKTLALDICTELPQILGRQRLDKNPYRNEAILFIKENSIGLSDKEFAEYIEEKKKNTEEGIKFFNQSTNKHQDLLIPKYRASMKEDMYKNDYVMVVEDKTTGKPKLAFNTLYMLAERRAWEISKKNYSSQYSVICQQSQAGITGISGTQSCNPDVLCLKKSFDSTNITDRKIKLYCDFRKQHPELVGEVDFVSSKYATYWNALGYDNLKALGFQESRIKHVLAVPTPFDSSLVIEIRKALKENGKYKKSEIKEKLQKIYKKMKHKKTAKAVDIERFITAKEKQNSRTGERFYEVESLFQKNITMFPFVWRPNLPMSLTIDRFLEIIKTGDYVIQKPANEKRSLKDVIAEIRKKTDHDERSKMKREWLPVCCVNGTFDYKDDRGLKNYSSFVALDFDGFTDEESMRSAKEGLKNYPFVYAIFETPSGKGLKAIVLHDSPNPTVHGNLYRQIMNTCMLPQTDTGVIDLSRGQFFSYDPDLWKNPNPGPFHFVFDPSFDIPVKSKEKYISVSGNTTSVNETKVDSWTEGFLDRLNDNLLTDDAILEILDKHWKNDKPEYFKQGNRHKSMLIISGTLCKAGVKREMTKEYLLDSFPGKSEGEIEGVCGYAYSNNSFGSERRRYK